MKVVNQPRGPGRSLSRNRGVTLVELLIVLAIIAILTAVVLPVYTLYQQRTFRTQATADLGDCAQALERFYTVNFTYAGANLATICTAVSPPNGDARYNLALTNADAAGYTLTATPIAGTSSAGNGALRLDGSGQQFWDRNDNGDFTDAGEDSWEE
ncbi:MAG: type IV pilin protein [Pseudomonadales bacterium]|jgi:type IV pilus assembly protein PilE|nr:type IV pilin protein [Pseudomonadales bacterium]